MTLNADILALIATALRIGGQLLLVPLLLKCIHPEELAAWYGLMSIGAIGGLFDMGVSGAIIRYSAAYRAGATEVPKNGLAYAHSGETNWEGINSLWGVAARFYKIASVTCATAIIALAYLFIMPSVIKSPAVHHPHLLAIIFTTGTATVFYSGFALNIIRGLGYVAKSHIILISTSISALLISTCLVTMGFGIISMPIGQIAGAAALYIFSKKALKGIGCAPSNSFNKAIFSSMIPNGLRMITLSFSGFLFAQTGVILSAKYLALASVGPLGLSNQVASTLSTIACIFSANRLPDFTACLVTKDHALLRKKFFTALFSGLALYITGSIIILLAGPSLIHTIGSKTELLQTPLLVLIFTAKAIELIHDQYAQLVMSQNKVPFITQSVIGGIAMVTGNYFAIRAHGIPGMLTVSILVLLLIYLPYPVWLGSKLLKKTPHEHAPV